MRYTTAEMSRPLQPERETRDQLIEELLAAMEARKELSRADERYLAEAFVDRMEREIDLRIEAKLASRRKPGRVGPGLLIPLLILAIPLSAIAGAAAHVVGLLIVWIALAGMVFAASR